VGTFVAAIVIAVAALLVLKPRYTATAQILFDSRKQNVFQLQAAGGGQAMAIDAGSVESEVSLIQSFGVLRRVVEKLKLDETPEFGPEATRGFSLLSLLPWRSPAREEMVLDRSLSPQQLAAIKKLRDGIWAKRVGVTYVVDISATSRDPLLAARISDALAESYLVEQLEARYETARRASAWFSERLVTLGDQLRQSEAKVAAFRQQYGLVDTQQGGGIDKQQVSELSAQLVLARAQTAEKRAKYEQAERVSKGSGSNAAVSEVLSSQLISNLRTQEAEVARREADLAAKYSGAHPLLANVRAEHADIKRAIGAEVQRIIANFRNEYEVALKREQSLEQSLARFTNVATANDNVKIRLNELEREVESNRTLYQNFLTHAKEAREETTLATNDSRIITPAVVPTTASFPRPIIFLSIAGILGLVGGVSLAFALDQMEKGFVTSEQVETATGLPVLAVLQKFGQRELQDKSGRLLTIPQYLEHNALTRFGEAMRTVRVSIHLSDVDNPPKVVLVTSSVPGEGKSTLAATLATSAALTSQRVLLIDGDIRHPSTSKLYGLDSNKGLVDFLAGNTPGLEAMKTFIDGRLTVLPAGTISAKSADLLHSQKMFSLIEAARGSYDLVIIDCPPVTAVVDSRVMANHVDKVLFVTEWRRTPREVVERAIGLMSEHRDRLVGLVINKANFVDMRYYSSYYSYYYSHSYKSYYEDAETRVGGGVARKARV